MQDKPKETFDDPMTIRLKSCLKMLKNYRKKKKTASNNKFKHIIKKKNKGFFATFGPQES